MANVTSSVTSAAIADVVSSMVTETLIQESVLIPTITDFSGMVGPGLDRLSIPRSTALAVQTVSESAALTPAAPTVSADTLLLDKNQAIDFRLTDIAALQTTPDMLGWIVRDAMKSLPAAVDDVICAQIVAASASTPDHRIQLTGTGNIEVTIADILGAQKLLNEARVPQQDRYMLINPNQQLVLLQIAALQNANTFGSREAYQNGFLMELFGFKIVMTTSSALADDEVVFYHKSAVGFARQMSTKFRVQEQAFAHAVDYSLSQIFGSILLDGGGRAVLYNNDGL